MMRSTVFAFSLVFALLVAAFAMRPPSPVGADVPQTVFSATRAMLDVETIAARPHPIGSTDILRVRQYLFTRLAALSLDVQRDHEQTTLYFPKAVARTSVIANVHNVVAILKGTSPDLPAILLMAHYDTVANSPGAPDDTAGVAALLEIAANLKAAGPLKRDVIFLFTEGEEAGLLGARAFFQEDELAKRVGLVLNLESRGGGGRAFMFETSADAGGLIAAYGKSVKFPAANSLSAFLYHAMPNGTDLTTAFDAKLPGLNFAFIGDEFAYHTASATPQSLNRGSLQHMGNQILALTRTFANADNLCTNEPDIVYGDLLGHGFISYSFAVGWGLIILLAVLIGFAVWKARAKRIVGGRGIAVGAGFFLLLLLVEGLVFFLAGRFLVGSFDIQAKYTMIGRYDLFIGGSVLLALAVAWGSARALRNVLTLWDTWLGGLVLLLVISFGLQIAAPATTLFVVWPLLPVALAAALIVAFANGDHDTLASLLIALPLAFLSMVQIAGYGSAIFLGLGGLLPLVIILPTFVAAIALYPGLDALIRLPRSGLLAVALVLLACISLGWAKYGPASAAHPRLTQAFYLAGPAPDQYARVSMLKSLDAWSEPTLTADGGRPEWTTLAPGYFQPAWRADAKPALVARPVLSGEVEDDAGRKKITLNILPAGHPRELRFVIRSDTELTDLTVGGIHTDHRLEAGEWSQFLYVAPPTGGASISLFAGSKGKVEMSVFEVSDGWPEGIAVPPKPEGYTPFQMSDATFAASTFDLTWKAVE